MPASYGSLIYSLAASIAGAAETVPVISVAGAQGSGKSTLARHLQSLLASHFSLETAVLSLDDFYLSREDRTRLAQTIHPLLQTRGVPGTHDVEWMQRAITGLRNRQTVQVPSFDKAIDDRGPRLDVGPVDVVICEGWCFGAMPQPEDLLAEPVNRLEQLEDPSSAWRNFVNEQLKAYQTLFGTDGHVYLQVPSMESVYQWRWQQEQELVSGGSGGDRVMDEQQVVNFIACYERLTRWMLETQPQRSDVVIELAPDHAVSRVLYR